MTILTQRGRQQNPTCSPVQVPQQSQRPLRADGAIPKAWPRTCTGKGSACSPCVPAIWRPTSGTCRGPPVVVLWTDPSILAHIRRVPGPPRARGERGGRLYCCPGAPGEKRAWGLPRSPLTAQPTLREPFYLGGDPVTRPRGWWYLWCLNKEPSQVRDPRWPKTPFFVVQACLAASEPSASLLA